MRGITRRFGTTTALQDFNLEMSGGQFVTLLGPSGCGKSTALNCLAGLLELSEGEIQLNDTPIQRSEEHTSELQSQDYLVCRLLLEIGRASCRERV